MTAVLVAAGVVLAAVWWPTGGVSGRRVRPVVPTGFGSTISGLPLVAGLAVGAVAGWFAGALVALATAALVATSVASFLVSGRQKRVLDAVEELRVFVASLVVHAQSSPTVAAAVAAAAGSTTGPVGEATLRLGEGCASGAVEASAERFAREVGLAPARLLADVILVAAETGSRWVGGVTLVERRLAAEAVAVRRFQEKVASMFAQVGFVALGGGGLVAAMATGVIPVVGGGESWLLTPSGKAVAAAAALISAVRINRQLAVANPAKA